MDSMASSRGPWALAAISCVAEEILSHGEAIIISDLVYVLHTYTAVHEFLLSISSHHDSLILW